MSAGKIEAGSVRKGERGHPRLTAPDTMVPMRVQTKARVAMGLDSRVVPVKPLARRMAFTKWNTPTMKPINKKDAPAVSWADWLE